MSIKKGKITKVRWGKIKSREDWLNMRSSVNGLGTYDTVRFGSSDVSTIMGYNKWSSRKKLFWNCLGMYMTSFHSFKLEMGLRYEKTNKESFECWLPKDKDGFDERFCTGQKLRKLQSPRFFLLNDAFDHSSSSLDFILPKNHTCPFTSEVLSVPRPVETKFVNYNSYQSWKGTPPMYYVSQCQHQTAMLNSDASYLSCIVSGDAYDCFYIERDEEFIKFMDYSLEEFKLRILKGKSILEVRDQELSKAVVDYSFVEQLDGMIMELEPEATEADLEFVDNEMYPSTNTLEMAGDEEAQILIDRYLQANEEEKEAGRQKTIIRTDITKKMQDFEVLKTETNKIINRRDPNGRPYFKVS